MQALTLENKDIHLRHNCLQSENVQRACEVFDVKTESVASSNFLATF